jgi:hypothetical protein
MLAIESYGRRWSRDLVYWTAGKKTCQLKGHARNNQSMVIDFQAQIGIYVLFDSAGQAVYVGQAGVGNKTLYGRLKDHCSDHLRDRWVKFSWFGLRGKNPKTNTLSKHHTADSWIRGKKRKDALHETEAVVMAVVEPPLNKRGPNWTGAKEFLQEIDARVPSDNVRIDSIADGVTRLERLMKRLDKRALGNKLTKAKKKQ